MKLTDSIELFAPNEDTEPAPWASGQFARVPHPSLAPHRVMEISGIQREGEER